MRTLTIIYIGCMAGIVALADAGLARPFFQLIQQTPGADKLGHLALYAGLASLVRGRRTLWLLLLVATAEECTHLVLAEREFAWLDMGANYVGIAAGRRWQWGGYHRLKGSVKTRLVLLLFPQ